MITEDYVSFETAKLLKEKGFNEPCIATYNSVTKSFEIENVYQDWTTRWEAYISAPTLQMVMKWLRKVHNLHCDIGYDDLDWFWNIISVDDAVPVEDRPKLLKDGTAGHKTYEEAVETALKYSLENLI